MKRSKIIKLLLAFAFSFGAVYYLIETFSAPPLDKLLFLLKTLFCFMGIILSFIQPFTDTINEWFLENFSKSQEIAADQRKEYIEDLIAKKKYHQAISECRNMQKIDSQDYTLQLTIANICADHLKSPQRAVQEFEKVLAFKISEETWVTVQNRMSEIFLLELSKKDKAIGCLQEIQLRLGGAHPTSKKVGEKIEQIRELY
jgi:tetratricopeptide (TPR) repeat protein